MRNLISLILFAVVSLYAAEVSLNTAGLNVLPVDVDVVAPYDGDTLTDSTYYIAGPYKVAPAKGQPAYKGFGYISNALGGTTPVCAIAYQLTADSAVTDTASGNWVTVDTLAATGTIGYVDLSSLPAQYIWFRVHNYDATDVIIDNFSILMKKNYTYSVAK